MSWIIPSVQAGTADEFDQKVADAVAAYKHSIEANDVDLDPAAVEQIDAAVAAAKSIVSAGVAGSGTFMVTLSGHANPDHKPVSGWANDCVTVYVSCADPQPTA